VTWSFVIWPNWVFFKLIVTKSNFKKIGYDVIAITFAKWRHQNNVKIFFYFALLSPPSNQNFWLCQYLHHVQNLTTLNKLRTHIVMFYPKNCKVRGSRSIMFYEKCLRFHIPVRRCQFFCFVCERLLWTVPVFGNQIISEIFSFVTLKLLANKVILVLVKSVTRCRKYFIDDGSEVYSRTKLLCLHTNKIKNTPFNYLRIATSKAHCIHDFGVHLYKSFEVINFKHVLIRMSCNQWCGTGCFPNRFRNYSKVVSCLDVFARIKWHLIQ